MSPHFLLVLLKNLFTLGYWPHLTERNCKEVELASVTQVRGYLDKLHITENVHRIVWCVDVVAATVELGTAASIVIALSDGGLRTVQTTATGRRLVHYKQRGSNEHTCYT